MANPIRVLIADDQAISRSGMRLILTNEKGIVVVDEATTISEAIEKAVSLRPDILVLDLQWYYDEQAGIDAIRRLRTEAPGTKVIGITAYHHLIQQARLAGAAAVLDKDIPSEVLVQEIRGVYALRLPGRKEADPPANEGLLEPLSEREREVLALIAEGKADKEIAAELHIAETTAKAHVSHILGKLATPNRAGAVAMGLRLGLISQK